MRSWHTLHLPVCGEGQPINSTAVNVLHLRRLRSQEIFHSHPAELIAWDTMRVKEKKEINFFSIKLSF